MRRPAIPSRLLHLVYTWFTGGLHQACALVGVLLLNRRGAPRFPPGFYTWFTAGLHQACAQVGILRALKEKPGGPCPARPPAARYRGRRRVWMVRCGGKYGLHLVCTWFTPGLWRVDAMLRRDARGAPQTDARPISDGA